MGQSTISTSSTINSRLGDYSRIGFEKTASIHFDDLKCEQANIRGKVTEVRKSFLEIKAREKAWNNRKVFLEQDEKEKKARREGGADVSSLWAISSDDVEEEMALDTAKIDFNQLRQDAIYMTKEWEQASSNQISLYPGFDRESRKKRAVDFVNLMRKHIGLTAPLGEEEEEDDKEWLKSKDVLPEEHPDLRGLKDRLRCSTLKETRPYTRLS